MIVWMMDKKLACPDCGTRQDEWDPKLGGILHSHHISKFTCIACKNIEDAYEDVRKSNTKGKLPSGFKIRLIPDYVWRKRAQDRKRLQVQKNKDRDILLREAAEDRERARPYKYTGLDTRD